MCQALGFLLIELHIPTSGNFMRVKILKVCRDKKEKRAVSAGE